jgi:hypothetical protein
VDEVEKIVEEVESLVSFFKIGLQLQYDGGRGIDLAKRLSAPPLGPLGAI